MDLPPFCRKNHRYLPMLRRGEPAIPPLAITLNDLVRGHPPRIVARSGNQRGRAIHPPDQQFAGGGVAAVMGNLNKCRRQMLPVAADHRLLRLTFYIAGQQDAGATVIDPHHAGVIVSLCRAARQRPQRLESESLPLPALAAMARQMTRLAWRAAHPRLRPCLQHRFEAAAMVKMLVAQHNPLQLQMVPAQPRDNHLSTAVALRPCRPGIVQ